MEEGWMLVEEGLFHPEEPSFLLRMAMMLPKEGTFLPEEGPVLDEEAMMLPIYRNHLHIDAFSGGRGRPALRRRPN